jgi:Ca2+-binding RTX toxin-like protein
MSITPHLLDSKEAFESELKNFFVKVEANKEQVYADIKGVPTVGIGYALIQEIKGVWKIRANLKTQMDAIGKTVTDADSKTLQDIADALNAGDISTATSLANSSSFSFEPMTSDEAKNLVVRVVNDEYIDALKNRIGATLYNTLANSKEMVALLSIVYQGWTSAIKQPLIDALSNGNRAEAWYQIRYAMNTSNAGWMANRRYQEADEFGLYENGSDPSLISEDEAKEIMRMYTIHNKEMHIYEIAYPPPSGQNVLSIDTEILKAKVVLVSNFGQGKSIDEVIVGAGLDSYAYLEKWTIDKIEGTSGNDLIFGEKGSDILDGGNGEDVIYGGEGNDMITGGQGNDYLEGGGGNDIYYINTGDGTDTIEDKEGNNRVFINGRLIGDFVKQADGTYKTPDGLFAGVMQGTDFVVTEISTGTKAILNKDFQDGDFGIHLLDTPNDPAVNNTIIVDEQYNGTIYDTAGNDRIEGLSGNDGIWAGNGGANWLLGGDGNDVVVSHDTSGNDIIEGNSGIDILSGGTGDDQIFGENKGNMETLIALGRSASRDGWQFDGGTAHSISDAFCKGERSCAEACTDVAGIPAGRAFHKETGRYIQCKA